MERPSKRQKFSSSTERSQQHSSNPTNAPSSFTTSSALSRTLDLAGFQRPYLLFDENDPSKHQRRRASGRVILPRAPDVTVTAGVVEVAVDGSISTQIAAPTTDVAVTLSSLGTLTIAAQTTPSVASNLVGSDSSTTSKTPSASDVSGSNSSLLTSSIRNNSTTTERTVTITATSTFRVSYTNGSFIAATSTRHSGQPSNSNSLGVITTIDSLYTQSTLTFDPDAATTSDTFSNPTGGQNTAGIGATATGSSLHGSSTSASGGNGAGNGGSGAPVLTPQQTQMVGGIVGGLAGIALVAFAMLYVLRWYRKRMTNKTGAKALIDFDPAHDHGSSGLMYAAGPMSSISQVSLTSGAGALVPACKKWRPSPLSAESEKGFQRISGRKIAPVLATGGDQYGESQPNIHNPFDEKVGVAISTPTARQTPARLNQRGLSDESIYSDFEDYTTGHPYDSLSEPTTPVHNAIGLYNNNGDRIRRPPMSHTRSYQDIALEDLGHALSAEVSRPDGFAVIRNSPARTPVTQSPSASSIALPFAAPVSMDDDIPEMPLTPLSPGHPAYGLGLGHDLLARRIPSRVSTRSNNSSGRFREELS